MAFLLAEPFQTGQIAVPERQQRPRAFHIPALDGIRGIAVLMVLACHLSIGSFPGGTAASDRIRDFMMAGWCGVDLFFVLSGFLITGILLDTRDAPNRVSSFYARRTLRIFPLYYAIVIASFFIAPLISAVAEVRPLTFGRYSYFLYLQNWYMPFRQPGRGLLGHFWSLGVEEQFYLVWPACVWFLPKKRLVPLCLSLCAAIFFLRFGLAMRGTATVRIYMNTITRVDTLLLGAFCALAVRDARLLQKVRPFLPWAAGLCLVGMLWIDLVKGETWSRGFYTETFGFTLLAAGFSSVVLYAYLWNGSRNWFDRIFSSRPARFLGKYSYGIYVYHAFVFLAANLLFKARGAGFSLALVAVSIALAFLSYHLFEKRFLRMKSRFIALEY